MNTQRAQQTERFSIPTIAIGKRLDEALAQIEQRFLDGGTVLVAVLDVFGGLLTSLGGISDALQEDEAAEATKELLSTAGLIAALPAQQQDMRERFVQIGDYGRALSDEVLAMEDTLRYLRTFAVTAKITGAGIVDFAGFAEEIVERIQFASQEVKSFGERIAALQDLIDHARTGNDGLARHDRAIPAIVEDLGRNASAIQTQRSTLADLAAKVTGLAMKVQGRLAGTLSSLQIGDVTRQRLEHCQAAFDIAGAHLAASTEHCLSDEDKERVILLVTCLVRDQLIAMSEDFRVECATIVRNIGAFSNDVTVLMDLQNSMLPVADDTAKPSAMGMVRESLETAQSLVGGIEQSAGEAQRLSASVGGMVKDLVESVETIQIVRTDIQYMALNTNLRCSKLGEESRAINVVTNELRAFSARLDDVTDRALAHLRLLDEQAAGLSRTEAGMDGNGDPDLVARIDIALAHVIQAGNALDEKLDDLQQKGQEIAIKVAKATAGLDFHQDLTAILDDCISLAADAITSEPSCDDLEHVLSGIGAEIFKTYTMKSERDIHVAIFGASTESTETAPAVQAQPMSDDELFDDALF
jgi:ABC-type transporter Mla subunit MlaD